MTFLDLYFMLAGYFLSSSYQQEVNYYLYQVFLLKGLKQEYGQIFFWFQFWIDHSFICPYLVDINSYILCGVFFFYLIWSRYQRGERRIKIVYPIFFNGIFLYFTYTCMFIFSFFFSNIVLADAIGLVQVNLQSFIRVWSLILFCSPVMCQGWTWETVKPIKAVLLHLLLLLWGQNSRVNRVLTLW